MNSTIETFGHETVRRINSAGFHIVSEFDMRDLSSLRNLLADLDRCEHGRHEGDDCISCGGESHGNPIARERQIGYSYSGTAISIPERDRKRAVKAWYVKAGTV